METTHSTQSANFGKSPNGWFKGSFGDAIRFWEPRRIIYNFALTGVCLAWILTTWPHFRPALTLSSLGIVTVLALLANVCYCSAYLVDIPAQHFIRGEVRNRGRWVLWLVGTVLAIVVANYWIGDEIYPFVR
ncbi:MAG: hypothetical protein WCD49_09810 [Candidatus Acidiferrales bacterium]